MRIFTLALLVLAFTDAAVGAQPPTAPAPEGPPRFDVASVKLNTSGNSNGSMRRHPGGRVEAVNVPLRTLIGYAYQVPPLSLNGGPAWLADARVDITARFEHDPPPGTEPDPLALALQALLADRLGLAVHRETRQADVYALVIASPNGKPAPALKPSTSDCSPEAIAARRTASSTAAASPVPFCGMQVARDLIRVGGLPLSQFATNLASIVGRPVLDRTGLTGNWEFELTFAADATRGLTSPTAESSSTDTPSVFTAIREHLGLKLEATKGPVEVVVIDRIEPLVPN